MTICKNGKLGYHDWKVIENNEKERVEVCTNCGVTEYYRKDKNGCDNKKFHDLHQKDFIQPADPKFKEFYN
jgi:predicted nucleic-acid-binding Zn-ribbon protein